MAGLFVDTGLGRADGPDVWGAVYGPGALVSAPKPRYPRALQGARIEGLVDLEYVVDTTGHAEPNSFMVVNRTHEAFVGSAKEAILKATFRLGILGGRPARQRVKQRISFKIFP